MSGDTKVWMTRHLQQFMNKARGKRRDGTKGKFGFSTKKGSYESPPGPPPTTPSSNLFLKNYCPKDGGNYNHPPLLPVNYPWGAGMT